MTELDLYNNTYDRETLKKNIYAIDFFDILKTQKLDVSFVTKYILNKNYQMTKEEETITIDIVLQYQTHLLRKDLEQYDSDDDSIEDFDQSTFRKSTFRKGLKRS